MKPLPALVAAAISRLGAGRCPAAGQARTAASEAGARQGDFLGIQQGFPSDLKTYDGIVEQIHGFGVRWVRMYWELGLGGGARGIATWRQPIDDVMTAFADELIQRLEIFAHALCLLRHGLHEAHPAMVNDEVEGRNPLAQRVVYAACSVRRCGCGFVDERPETLVDLRRLRSQPGQGLS